eukprot:gene8801-14836_t
MNFDTFRRKKALGEIENEEANDVNTEIEQDENLDADNQLSRDNGDEDLESNDETKKGS